MTINRLDEADIFARTIYGEARGEGLTGMESVACVIMNRVQKAKNKNGCWWGNTPAEVCLKPWQFSCWNPNDPNFKKLQTVDDADTEFRMATRIAARALAGNLKDITDGATHYHALSVSPLWARCLMPCAQIQNHLFYAEEI